MKTLFSSKLLKLTSDLYKHCSMDFFLLFGLTSITSSHCNILCWLCCCLAFSLLRSAIQSIRGACLSCGHAVMTPTVLDLVNHVSNTSNFYTRLIHFLSSCYILFIWLPCILSKKMRKKTFVLPERGDDSKIHVLKLSILT